jgi:hypothetical protein
VTRALLLATTLLAAPRAEARAAAPCIRLDRAGTEVRNDTRVCPGRYRIMDAKGRGVLVVAVSGVRLDLSGVVLESGDSVPERFTGVGVLSRNVDSLVVTGGTIRGYRFGIVIEGGRGRTGSTSSTPIPRRRTAAGCCSSG